MPSQMIYQVRVSRNSPRLVLPFKNLSMMEQLQTTLDMISGPLFNPRTKLVKNEINEFQKRT